MAGKKSKRNLAREDPPEIIQQIESAENPASEDEVPDDQEELEPLPGRFKRTKGKTRSVIGRSYLQGNHHDLRQRLSPHHSEDKLEEDSRPYWMAQVIAEVSQSVRNEVKDIVAGSSRESDVTAKDLEDVLVAQRLIDLQAEAAKLTS
jgi:hypothetical protein